jgi:hypothetical protein
LERKYRKGSKEISPIPKKEGNQFPSEWKTFSTQRGKIIEK